MPTRRLEKDTDGCIRGYLMRHEVNLQDAPAASSMPDGEHLDSSPTYFFQIRHVSKSFGGLDVINDLSFDLIQGQTVGIIGPNGSGKTTLFNLISGFLQQDKGEILFLGKDISHRRPSEICKAGITRTFQLVRPFPQLTALENVTAGRSYGRVPALNLKQATRESLDILATCGMADKHNVVAAQLNLIYRKRLEIARGLATNPKLLLLDEVFAGLNPAEIEEALSLLVRIKGMGITLVIVEHLMKVILGVSERVLVMNYGVKIFDGLPSDAVNDELVVNAYLGEDFHA